MTLAQLERGFEIHTKQMQEMRDHTAVVDARLDRISSVLEGMLGRADNHEKQMQELRDNQVVQGAMLAKASSLLVELATSINEIAERQAITQSGIESLVAFMEAFKKHLGGGNGHPPD